MSDDDVEVPSGGATTGRRTRWRLIALGVIALASAAATGVLVAGIVGGNRHGPRPSAAAARAFLAEERRSRTGTWIVVSRFERRLRRPASRPETGQTASTAGGLRGELRTVQRPPDQLRAGFGQIEARRAGRKLACATGGSGRLACRDVGPALAWDQTVDQDLRRLTAFVTGPRAPYSVTRTSRHCFLLRLRGPVPGTPVFGTRAWFCFDAATAAPTFSEIWRDGAVDREQAVEVRRVVTDADLTPGSQ